MTLSVCLIVRDEEEVIGRCLNCVCKFADEIVVVDTGSKDGTVAEAKKFTENIGFFAWCDDFSAARNYAFDRAQCDFVMWLDADDVVTDENCLKIRRLVDGAPAFDMAFLPYAAASDGDAPTFFYYRERIMRRSKNYRFAGAVHEAVAPAGRIIYSDACICHKKLKAGDSFRNLRILQKQIDGGMRLDERARFYYGRELLFHRMYRECAAVLEDFLKQGGWIENRVQACLDLYDAYTALGEGGKAEEALLRSFSMALPTSRACCILGEKFMRVGDDACAVFWYERALQCASDGKSGAFCNADFNGFVPYMQLCVLYDRRGDYEKANAFNEAAGAIKPCNKNYLSNKEYFRKKLQKED